MTNRKSLIITVLLACVCFLTLSLVLFYNFKLKQTQIKVLTEENQRLELDLADRENEIYALTLELKSTEKTLAETAHELDELALKLNALETELEASENVSLEYIGDYKCTAYCCEKYAHICGTGTGKTASGVYMQPDVTVAVTDLKKMPYGTMLYIEDVGIRIVQDTGNFPKSQIDCAVDTHKHALNWKGQGKHKVYILKVNNE